MEEMMEISYKGYRTSYKIISPNQVQFYAVLTGFTGRDEEAPPKELHFIHYNHRIIATVETIAVARVLVNQLNFKHGLSSHSG